jgi:hypothetical protein
MAKWFTRARPKIDRVSCPWLIKRFIDPDAEIIYLPKDPDGTWTSVVKRAKAEGGKSIDAEGADFFDRVGPEYPDGQSSTFEMMVETYKLNGNEALMRLADIIHAADGQAKRIQNEPRAAGLLAITVGGLEVEPDDYKLLEKEMFLYDALYAWCQKFPDGGYS